MRLNSEEGVPVRLAVIYNGDSAVGAAASNLVKAQFKNSVIKLVDIRGTLPEFWVPKKNTKATYEKGPNGDAAFAVYWAKLQAAFDAFVCVDVAVAHYLLPERDRSAVKKTDVLSGMIVQQNPDGTKCKPLLFLMTPNLTFERQYTAESRAQKTLQCAFHIKKLWRLLNKVPSNEAPVSFVMPTSREELDDLKQYAAGCTLLAVDIETTGGQISCVGFAGLHPKHKNTVSFVIPYFMNDKDSGGLYWDTEETTAYAIEVTRGIMANTVPKCYHNGSYDQTFQYKWHMPANAYIFDTQHMLHCTWPSIDKRLYQGAAMFLDNYRYWKDDAKDAAEDGKTQKHFMPTSVEGHANYWRYNAMDCVNTLELCLALLNLWSGSADAQNRYPDVPCGYKHAMLNYVREFPLQVGPCMYMSMVGMRASKERQEALGRQLIDEAIDETIRLRALLADNTFNPRSTAQVQELYYDVLNMPVNAKKGRSTDKRIVQELADMHPLFRRIVDRVHAAKEPAANAGKYASLPLQGGCRLLTNLKAGTTTTARLASAKHNYGVGTNMQNFPKPMRVFARADEGCVLCSADYSQSDSYFVAFESQDAAMIDTVTDDRDTHSVHAEFFFGHPYADIVKGAAAKEAWVVHPITGIRQIIKRVSHGTNYDMGGETMLMNIRKDAAVAMVKALIASKNRKTFMQYMGSADYINVDAWTSAQLAKACKYAQSLYYKMYPKLAAWKKEAVQDAADAKGVITMFGGSAAVMLGNPKGNSRFVPAAFGQGGTAGNINNAMLRLYFLNQSMWDRGFKLIMQVHDEVVTSIPEDDLDLIHEQKQIMEAACVIHGRSFSIPVEASLSYVWSEKYAVPYVYGTKHADMLYAARQQEAKLVQLLRPRTEIA